jgi:hypothetical protein
MELGRKMNSKVKGDSDISSMIPFLALLGSFCSWRGTGLRAYMADGPYGSHS